MNNEEEWNEKAEHELMDIKDGIFYRFWQEKFRKTCLAHSYEDEFELESCTVDHNFVKDFFSSEMKLISEIHGITYFQSVDNFILDFKLMNRNGINLPKISVAVNDRNILMEFMPFGMKAFQFFEYRIVLEIVSDLCAADLNGLIASLKEVHSRYWINEKNAELATVSINALCRNLLERNGVNYDLQSHALFSVISHGDQRHQIVHKTFIHKEFNENPRIVMAYIQDIWKNATENQQEVDK